MPHAVAAGHEPAASRRAHCPRRPAAPGGGAPHRPPPRARRAGHRQDDHDRRVDLRPALRRGRSAARRRGAGPHVRAQGRCGAARQGDRPPGRRHRADGRHVPLVRVLPAAAHGLAGGLPQPAAADVRRGGGRAHPRAAPRCGRGRLGGLAGGACRCAADSRAGERGAGGAGEGARARSRGRRPHEDRAAVGPARLDGGGPAGPRGAGGHGPRERHGLRRAAAASRRPGERARGVEPAEAAVPGRLRRRVPGHRSAAGRPAEGARGAADHARRGG